GCGHLTDGDRIAIEHTMPVTLVLEGRQQVMHTVGGTVRDVLDDLAIRLDDDDRTEPGLDEKVRPGDRLRVVRVERVLAREHKENPFSVVRKQDPGLNKGKEKVVSEGRAGLLEETVEILYEDGIP